MQKLKSDKPLRTTVKKWTQEAILSLQGCFDCFDWAMFSESCAHQGEYADTVTSYVSFCTDSCIPSKMSQSMQMTNPGSQRTSTTNSLQKMTLSRTVIKTSTKNLNIKLRRHTEQKHSTEINLKNSSQHPTAMLCGKSPSINRNQHLQTMTPPSQINWITSTPDSTGRTPPKLQATLALRRLCLQTQIQVSHHLPLPVRPWEVKHLFTKLNIRKAAGPDNVSPSTLESCAEQLAPVFCEIYNHSLSQCKVPTCFKPSTIIPVPPNKRNKAVAIAYISKGCLHMYPCPIKYHHHSWHWYCSGH